VTLARPSRLHVILLAGGSGTRFWPASRAARPKQFLALAGREPLLIDTWRRVRKLAPVSRIRVVAPARLVGGIRELLPGLRPENLIVEPSPRDTGPAIALACAMLGRDEPSALAAVFPTDHVIRDREAFARSVAVAAAAATEGALVCLGVRPDRPATGFGYLRCAARPRTGRAVAVERFVEKPPLQKARAYLRSGRYLWNAGMFVWRVDRFAQELRRTAPAIARAIEGTLAGRRGAWARAPRRSVDYAVMEKAEGVRVVPLRAGWDDVGSWEAATRLRAEAGLADGAHVRIDSPGSAIFGDERPVALVGLPGVTVVDTADALLVVSNEKAERVREVVEELRRRRRKDLL